MSSLKEKKELVSLRIPVNLNKKLEEYVAPMGLSKNAYILGLLNRELDKARLIGAKQEAKA